MMRKTKKFPTKKMFKVLGVLLAVVLLSGCAQKIDFPTSEVLPAAEAVLEVNEDKSSNYELELEVSKMAKPDRLTPPRRNYVVWMVSEKHGTINLGNLRITNKNRGTLSTVTPYKPIRVFITAEDTKDVISPSTQVVLSTDEFNVK